MPNWYYDNFWAKADFWDDWGFRIPYLAFLIIYAAIAMKEMMEKEHLPGTIVIWPGVAEVEKLTSLAVVEASCVVLRK